MNRYAFVNRSIEGVVLDVGCRDSPFQANYNMDIDMWRVPNFVRGVAQELPFRAKSVDTVILAEILEHLSNPVGALEEAKRVARDRVVVTVPSEEARGVNPWENLDEERGERWAREHPCCRKVCDKGFLEKLGYRWEVFTERDLKKLLSTIFPSFTVESIGDENYAGVGALCILS